MLIQAHFGKNNLVAVTTMPQSYLETHPVMLLCDFSESLIIMLHSRFPVLIGISIPTGNRMRALLALDIYIYYPFIFVIN